MSSREGLSTRTRWVIVIVALVGVAAFLAGIVWLSTSAISHSSKVPASTSSPKPTVSAGPSAADVKSFTLELQEKAYTTAAAAAAYSGMDLPKQRIEAWNAAGFPAGLAETFEPVWVKVFGTPAVLRTTLDDGTVLSSATANISGGRFKVVGVTGRPGERTYTVQITMDVTARWTNTQRQQRFPDPFEGTWTVTIEEASGQVTSIEQPALSSIPFKADK